MSEAELAGESERGLFSNVECVEQTRAIYLIDNKGIPVEKFKQWLAIIALPILSFLCIWAGFMAARTHRKISFDAFVLFTVALYNCVFMFTEFVRCSAFGELLHLLLSTCLILFTFYNFQIVIRSLQGEVTKMEHLKRRHSPSGGDESLSQSKAPPSHSR